MGRKKNTSYTNAWEMTLEGIKDEYRKGGKFFDLPDSEGTDYDDWPRRNWANFMVTTDWHCPFHNKFLGEMALLLALRFNIDKMVLGGDLWNQDVFSKYVNRDKIPFKREQKVVKGVLNSLLATFNEIIILSGNHDKRLLKLVDYEIDEEDVLNTILNVQDTRLVITRYSFCHIGDEWHITHPESYSRIKLRVARDLEHKWDRSIVMAHGHFLSLGRSTNGRHYLIDSGGILDPKKFNYKAFRDTTYPEWNPGFLMVKDNVPYLFDMNTDYDWWLKAKP